MAGLLMAPQGIGAACIMRWAGSITDRFGPRRVVPFGILLMAAATVPFAFVTASTSLGFLAVTLFVRGLGLGLSMMPVTAAAYFDLNHAEIPKASTVMNIVRLVGGSVATALFAVVLERQIIANLGSAATKAAWSAGVIGATAKLPPQVADSVAAAFAHTFWWSVGAIMIAFVPTLFLPNHAAVAPPERRDHHRRPRGRRHARVGTDADRDTAAASVAARLARAGFVAAADEADELIDAADGDAGRLESLSNAAWTGSRWPGSPAGPPSATSPSRSIPASTCRAGRASSWHGGRPPDSPTAAAPSTCAPGPAPSRWHSRAARPQARVVATDVDPRAVACAGANGVEVYAGDLFAVLPRISGARHDVVVAVVPYVPTAELGHLPERHPPNSRTRRTTTVGGTGPTWSPASSPRRPGYLRPGGTVLLELGGDQAALLRPLLDELGYAGSRRGATRTATSAASRRGCSCA